MSTTLLVTHQLMHHSSLPIWSSEDSLWLCWLPPLAIRLRVCRWVEFHLYFEVLTKLPNVMIVELATIVCYQGVRDLISIDKVSTHKGNYLLLCDPAECFHLDPFCEIIYCHNNTCSCSSSFWQRPDQINSPVSKRPWWGHSSKLFWCLCGEVGKALATFATHSFLLGILVHCRLEVPLPESLVGKRSSSGVISTNPFVHVS